MDATNRKNSVNGTVKFEENTNFKSENGEKRSNQNESNNNENESSTMGGFNAKVKNGVRTKSLGFYVSDQAKNLLKKVYDDTNLAMSDDNSDNDDSNSIGQRKSLYSKDKDIGGPGFTLHDDIEKSENELKTTNSTSSSGKASRGDVSPPPPPPPSSHSPSIPLSPGSYTLIPPPPNSPPINSPNVNGNFGLSSPEKRILLSIAPPSPSIMNIGSSSSPSSVPPPPPSISPSHAGLSLLGEALDQTSNDYMQNSDIDDAKQGRATTVVSKLRNMRQSTKNDPTKPTNFKGVVHPFIANSYINEVIANSNPFSGRSLELLSPDQFSVLVDNSLFTPKSIRDGHRMLTALTANDIVVVGASIRTGAAAVVKVIDSLIHENVNKHENISKRIPWIESKYNEIDPVIGRAVYGENNRRAYLSYFSCNTIQAQCMAHKKRAEVPKFIVVIRHPLDARLSFFRFARRIYRKTTKDDKNNQDFDRFLVTDDFARIPLAPVTAQAQTVEENSYESNLCKWFHLQAQFKENVMFVFYEDLIFNTQLLVSDICDFLDIEISQTKKNNIIQNLTKFDPEYPIGQAYFEVSGEKFKRKNGSSNRGHLKFCPMSVAYIHSKWKRYILQSFPAYSSFESLYSKFRQSPFPFPPRELTDAMSEVSGNSTLGTSSNTTLSRKSLVPNHSRNPSHSRNVSASISREVIDSTLGLFAGNEEYLVNEIAKRYPYSYAARKELGIAPPPFESGGKSEGLNNTNAAKKKSVTQRFSIFSAFRRTSTLASQPKQNATEIDTATMTGSSLQPQSKSTQGREASHSIALQERVDSDDSENED